MRGLGIGVGGGSFRGFLRRRRSAKEGASPGGALASSRHPQPPVRCATMSSIGSVGRNGGGGGGGGMLGNGLPASLTLGNGVPASGGSKKDSSSVPANGPLLETTTVKKGLLWQQWDKFFSRWKERYFVLTKDYLACFKKESKVGTSEMGGFLYKVNLADVEGLQWADKKRTGVIALRVGTEGQLLLWTNCGLDDWMFALRDAIGRSKGRREALRKAHTLGPQFYDAGLTKRQALLLQHTLTSSEAQSPSSSVRTSTSCELRSLGERTPTPSLTRRAQRMSVATEASDSGSLAPTPHPPLAATGSVDYDTRSVPWSAPLGPRPTGSYSSLVSLGQRSLGAHRPSPRSLQVSPALAQRSLYAQHVLNSPEVANGRNGGGPRCGVGGATASATLEFAYIRPDSPVTLTGPRRSTLDSGHCQRSQSSCFGANPFLQLGEPLPQQHKLLQQQQRHHRNHKHQQQNHHHHHQQPPHHQPAPPFALHDLRTALPGGEDEARPSSIYGQPSLTVVGDRAAYSVQPPDVVPNHARPSASKLMKRAVRAYTHSKSDSSFVLKQSPSQLQGHLAVT